MNKAISAAGKMPPTFPEELPDMGDKIVRIGVNFKPLTSETRI